MTSNTSILEPMLVSDLCISYPTGFVVLASCPAGYWVGSPDITRAKLLAFIKGDKDWRTR